MNDTPLVIVYPRGQLTAEDKALLHEGGIIAIEADDPKSVQQLHLAAPLVNTTINGDMIVRAALKAIAARSPEDNSGFINGIGRAAHEFVKLISQGIEPKEPM